MFCTYNINIVKGDANFH